MVSFCHGVHLCRLVEEQDIRNRSFAEDNRKSIERIPRGATKRNTEGAVEVSINNNKRKEDEVVATVPSKA